jgi:hypothetical protein
VPHRDDPEDPHVEFVVDAERTFVDLDLVLREGDPRHHAQKGEVTVVEVLEPEERLLVVGVLARCRSGAEQRDAAHGGKARDAVGYGEDFVVLHLDGPEPSCLELHCDLLSLSAPGSEPR